ncbi:MAG: protein-methionine-sulfoxide reductase catalytic subunit MsrP, partial [Hydrogenophaga sp.]|nr:protein-methionine-sulfoxide reductase catalytic subunit MsrP [Hydrogenophaga sp.]
MLIRTRDNGFEHPIASEITPAAAYLRRREWLAQMAAGAGALSLAGWAARDARAQMARPGKLAPLPGAKSSVAGASTVEAITAYDDAALYNNFYEFGTDKSDPAAYSKQFKTRPWTVQVEGLVKTPKTYGIDELLKLSAMEERIYRMRCVEGWSMVIPWVGYSVAELIKKVEPLGSAKYVEFVTLADKAQMPGLRSGVLDWPYVEGLRL